MAEHEERVHDEECHPSSTASVVTFENVDTLRSQCDALVASSTIDKDTALGFLRLVHGFETLILREQHAKDQQTEKMRHELSVVRLSQKQAEMVETLSTECMKLRRITEARDETISGLTREVEGVKHAIGQLQQNTKRR